jgi:hypothetical protein
MNVSPEKQKLFERLHAEETEVVRFGHDFTPPELARQEDLTEYRLWRHYNKEIPAMNKLSEWLREEWRKEAEAKAAQDDG